MITAGQVYWITRLDSFNCAFGVFAIILLVSTVITLGFGSIGYCSAYEANDRDIAKLMLAIGLKKLVPITLIFTLLACVTPSTKEMAAIIVLPKIINNPKVQQIPDSLLTLANEWMQELRPKHCKEKK